MYGWTMVQTDGSLILEEPHLQNSPSPLCRCHSKHLQPHFWLTAYNLTRDKLALHLQPTLVHACRKPGSLRETEALRICWEPSVCGGPMTVSACASWASPANLPPSWR